MNFGRRWIGLECNSRRITAKVLAGKIIQTIAPIVGGKGNGKDAAKLDETLVKAGALLV